MIRKFYDYGGLDPIGGDEPFSISDYNQRCAEFLGYKKDTVDGRNVVRIPNKTWSEWSNRFQDYVEDDWYALYEPSIHSLEFHSDCNWIMEVVEAIEKLGFSTDSYSKISEESLYEFNIWDKINPEIEGRGETRKEAVVQAIDKFLIWYNENK